MSRTSKIRELPAELQAAIAELRDHGYTIDEITQWLVDKGAEVSRSSVGRHIKSQAQVAASIRHSRELAEAMVKQFGASDDSKVARLNLELLHGIVMRVALAGEEDGELTLKPNEVLALSKAVDHLGKAEKDNAATVSALRKAALEHAAEQAVGAVRKAGLSEETIRQIQRDVLGQPQGSQPQKNKSDD